jgi:DNA-binding NarL/FixJ family response regulator
VSAVVKEAYERVMDKILHSGITYREWEVYEQLIQGKDIETIARLTGTSPFTVKKHKLNLYKKLGVNSELLLLRHAFDNGDLRRLDNFTKKGIQSLTGTQEAA